MAPPRKRQNAKSKNYIGSSTFTDGQPVCSPVRPGRRVKPLEGPVHPGFPKKNSSNVGAKKKKAPIKPGIVIQVADQNDDLYKPLRKVKPKLKKKK